MFLRLYAGPELELCKEIPRMQDVPLVSQDASVVDENGDAAKRIQRSFHNGGTLGDDVVRVGDSLTTSYAVSQYQQMERARKRTVSTPFVISSTTFCAAAWLTSLTSTFAPLDA